MNVIFRRYRDLLIQKRYSNNTIKTYCSYFNDFLNHFESKRLEELTTNQINTYILELIKNKDISTSQQNQRINAIKFYYEKVLGREKQYYNIYRPKKESKLPTVLSENEVRKLINQISNFKHRAIVSLIYSAGLRISETVNLKLSDIDSDRKLIHIRGAKGKKDRTTILSKTVLEILRNYYRQYKPNDYLFQGQSGGQYSVKSIQNIVRKAVNKTDIKKHVTVHTLRHSFATHLLEHGTDIRYIQELLGHSSSKTTEIYTHITKKGIDKIVSPIDNLNIRKI